MVSNLSENLYETEKNYDLARLRLLHKSCWVDFPLDNPDWTVRLNAYYALYIQCMFYRLGSCKILEWGKLDKTNKMLGFFL